MTEKGILQSIGGKSKLASLLDRTVHSHHIRQHAQLVQQKYYRRIISESLISTTRTAKNAPDFEQAVSQGQSLFEKFVSVTGDSNFSSDSSIPDGASFRATVTLVTQILAQELP